MAVKEYRIFGYRWLSNFDLGIPAEKSYLRRAGLTFKILKGKTTANSPAPPAAELNLPGFGKFEFDPRSKSLTLRLQHKHAREHVQSIVLNQGVPFALVMMGELLVHAAAIRTAKGAVVFMGRKGQGKSTLAARAAAHGLQVMADDLVRIRIGKVVTVYPSFPEVRLFAKDIKRHSQIAHCVRSSPLKKRVDIHKHFYPRPLRLYKIVQMNKSRASASQFSDLHSSQRFRWLMDNVLHPPTLVLKHGVSRHFGDVVKICQLAIFERMRISHSASDFAKIFKRFST